MGFPETLLFLFLIGTGHGDREERVKKAAGKGIRSVYRCGFPGCRHRNRHGIYQGVPRLDVERLSEIRKVVAIPLVLHGTSGVPDEAVRECIQRGICKVNYATDLRIAFAKGGNEVLGQKPDTIDPKKYNAQGRKK